MALRVFHLLGFAGFSISAGKISIPSVPQAFFWKGTVFPILK